MGTGLTQQSFTAHGIMHKAYALALRHWLKSTEQGAATQVWAATAPGLEAHSGAYLQNCTFSQPSAVAANAEHAAALWDVTATQVRGGPTSTLFCTDCGYMKPANGLATKHG